MDNQEIFDRVYVHLLTQGKRSMRDGHCLYRCEGGLSCAVGCLIPDEEYEPAMEGSGVASVSLKHPGYEGSPSFILRNVLIKLGCNEDNLFLLDALQKCHDMKLSHEWPARLAEIAKQFKLTIPAMPTGATP